jgi:hypothetical protein
VGHQKSLLKLDLHTRTRPLVRRLLLCTCECVHQFHNVKVNNTFYLFIFPQVKIFVQFIILGMDQDRKVHGKEGFMKPYLRIKTGAISIKSNNKFNACLQKIFIFMINAK